MNNLSTQDTATVATHKSFVKNISTRRKICSNLFEISLPGLIKVDNPFPLRGIDYFSFILLKNVSRVSMCYGETSFSYQNCTGR